MGSTGGCRREGRVAKGEGVGGGPGRRESLRMGEGEKER